MKNRLVRLALVAGVVAAIGSASPASAAACVGTQNTAGICVGLTREGVYSDCVYVGPPPCIPVYVYGYGVDCWGWIGDDGVIMCA